MYPQPYIASNNNQANIPSNQSLILKNNTVQEIRTDIIQIAGKRLIFGNTVYQIPNIAGFSTAKISNMFPWIWCLILLFLVSIDKEIIIKLIIDQKIGKGELSFMTTAFNLILLSLLLIIIFKWAKKESTYGLLIISNAGNKLSTLIIHNNQYFINHVVAVLSSNIDSSYEKSYIINFNNNTISQSNLSIMNKIGGDQEQSNNNYTKNP